VKTKKTSMTEVFCSNCGARLDELADLSKPENPPCPKCGSKQQDINITVADGINVSDHMTAVGKKDDKTVGFRESERNGRIASADQNENGSLSYSLTGSSPQGEEDTLSTCKNLVQALNEAGWNWAQPQKGEGVEDCTTLDKSDQRNKLRIQVVRAITDENLWRRLSLEGGIEESSISKDELLAQLKSSIERKSDDRKIPASIRSNLLLALDATRLPVLSFEGVIEEYVARFGSWTRSLGFQGVWLVGPISSLTWRLDR
jgi:DNA-directed RNA polymerase subunit RPC12/RpoP